MGNEELHLPTFADKILEPSSRTMDEIDQWIEQDYALFFDRKLYGQEKTRLSVNEPFRL